MAYTYDEDGVMINYDKTPLVATNICPICNQGGKHSIENISSSESSNQCCITYKCCSCRKFFITVHDYPLGIGNSMPDLKTYPYKQIKIDIPEYLKNDYPEFYDLYIEAMTAESYNLLNAAGMVYRKSLESLVKNYWMKKLPEETETIKTELLSKTINRFEEPLIKSLAKASSWLGNDASHIVKRHPDYSVVELKKFIRTLFLLLAYYSVGEDAQHFVDNS
ncbi:hypothetical protein HZY86_01165 [Aerococcaceae bacterium DSM 111020]|nr:hypothetical protein [Aerococcaceae bacterium DSM 111020]